MTRLCFLKGLREIGGTFAIVETDHASCMFDFGFANSALMDARILNRPERAAECYVRMGFLAAADGIYDRKTAERLGLKPFGETDRSCFFLLSHMHIDHMGGLGLLAPEIPVYMSEDSRRLYRRLAANGEAEFFEHENCIGLPYGEPVRVADITVTAIPVDHDVVGACGFLISTPDGSIAYTGDYRFHGFHPEITEAFARAVKGASVMITEGVSVSFEELDMLSLKEPEPKRSEENLQEEIKTLSEELHGLLVINPYNRNVERLHRLALTCAEAGRVLVLDARCRDYLRTFSPEDPACVYENALADAFLQPGDKYRQYDERKTVPSEGGGQPDGAAGDCIRDIPAGEIVTREELTGNPGHYVLQNDYSLIGELMDLREVISLYVHMDGTPLGDYDPSFGKLQNFMNALGIPYRHMSLGGHSDPWHLRHMIDTAEPKTLIPLHSFRPEQVNSLHIRNRLLPEPGVWYELSPEGII